MRLTVQRYAGPRMLFLCFRARSNILDTSIFMSERERELSTQRLIKSIRKNGISMRKHINLINTKNKLKYEFMICNKNRVNTLFSLRTLCVLCGMWKMPSSGKNG